ncbi:alpha/beta hydrolase [Pyruvatibacter sp.]|uniref:alpha/beta fold hydrolase n=1 Tax=Pyruvatibacter sp. TaxID=1981328 RepID=UPI0032EBDDB4
MMTTLKAVYAAGLMSLVSMVLPVMAQEVAQRGDAVPGLPAPAFSTIEANGISFAYVELGKGPLVLLLHGYPATARSWWPVQQRLAAAGYRTVAPNMRGYPPTSLAPDGDYTVGTLGADALALVDALGETSAVIVGQDWGATAAMSAAATAPNNVTGLVSLVIPHPMATEFSLSLLLNAPHFLYYQLPWASWMVARNDFAHIDGIYDAWSPTFAASDRDLTDIKKTMAMEGGVDGPLGYYWSIGADPTPGTMAATDDTRFAMPSLVIAGADDGALDTALFAEGRDGFVGPFTYVELANVGHFPQIEAPEAVAEALLDFLATLKSQAPPVE